MQIDVIEVQPIFNDWNNCKLQSDAFIHIAAFDTTGNQVVSQSLLMTSSKSPAVIHECLFRNCNNILELMRTMHPKAKVIKKYGIRKVWPDGSGEIKETPYDV